MISSVFLPPADNCRKSTACWDLGASCPPLAPNDCDLWLSLIVDGSTLTSLVMWWRSRDWTRGRGKGSICIGKMHCSRIGTWEVIGERRKRAKHMRDAWKRWCIIGRFRLCRYLWPKCVERLSINRDKTYIDCNQRTSMVDQLGSIPPKKV